MLSTTNCSPVLGPSACLSLQVEVDRLVEAAWFQGSRRPRDVLQRVQERLTERGPIITWALDVWMQEELSRLPLYNQVVQVGMQSRCDAHAAYMQPQGAHTCNQVVQVGM